MDGCASERPGPERGARMAPTRRGDSLLALKTRSPSLGGPLVLSARRESNRRTVASLRARAKLSEHRERPARDAPRGSEAA